jgi:hypothetical protein
MPINIQKDGIDLDLLLEPRGSLPKRADVNIQASSTDISNTFAAVSATDGIAFGDVNIGTSGTDIGTLFAKHGSVFTAQGLWSFGLNTNGGLGNNNRTAYSSPVQVGTATTWKHISAGRLFSAVVDSSSRLW